MGERAKFYRNKEGRWAFSPRMEPGQEAERQWQDRGLSPEEIKRLTELTEASMQLVPH